MDAPPRSAYTATIKHVRSLIDKITEEQCATFENAMSGIRDHETDYKRIQEIEEKILFHNRIIGQFAKLIKDSIKEPKVKI